MKKVLLTIVVLGTVATVGGFATFSAFSSTTANSGNSFAAGTVYISDNDSGSAMYSVSNQKPADSVQKCIKVTYTGTLDSSVKLYASAVGAVGQYIDLTVETGSGNITFPSCTGFTADSGGALYSGTLQNFANTKNSYANGVVDYPGSNTSWVTNDAVVYEFTVALQSGAPDSAQGTSTGSHAYTWEARSQ